MGFISLSAVVTEFSKASEGFFFSVWFCLFSFFRGCKVAADVFFMCLLSSTGERSSYLFFEPVCLLAEMSCPQSQASNFSLMFRIHTDHAVPVGFTICVGFLEC